MVETTSNNNDTRAGTNSSSSVAVSDGVNEDDLVHLVAEHHKGRSAAFSTKEDDIQQKLLDTTKTGKQNVTSSFVFSPVTGWVLLIFISIVTYPGSLSFTGDASIAHVWYYGWITALSTGLGVLPLVFIPHLDKFWIGASNAMAAGMMTAASYSLIMEGCSFTEPTDTSSFSSPLRTAFGSLLGLIFILSTQKFLDKHEDLKVGTLTAADAKKIVLIMFVMTLHSFTEGVGIGVSFGGSHGQRLGVFISASLAVHNVPEGLAVAIVLLPRKVSKWSASLWCVLTSIPQPIMAVPAYMFVHHFIPFLPIGLGFAGGAMAWVAFAELLVEAYEDTDAITTAIVSSISLGLMMTLQNALREE
mmetsp:Transcript_26480/g.37953  ORF Transcript_26480/g.37953 Transcript_26480/m.37953 type:complete len:359 (+) Transcript_26480:268-1344(+)|eukprot:CAMPEP_0172428214 /NCGR_PEP_ID=MMETSP1064-20121228/45520_1 /TAXON_ID=202472 /ORGANISM="Aulacoseira subarctica , Strain CCAP 1002/5" /LENGTH=358 /DNA_ID=CAMNT_0013172887 /DNA_START=171 /DNA_END=1247 /DNA_ORIENTATION=-